MKKIMMKLLIFLVLTFSIFYCFQVKAIIVDFSTETTDTISTVNGYSLKQTAEWIDTDKVKYTMEVNADALDAKRSINVIVYNVSNYMSEEEIIKYKASLIRIVKYLGSRAIIMDEQTYLDYINAGERRNIFDDNSTSDCIKNIVNAPAQSKQLVFDIDLQDVKNLYGTNESNVLYRIIHINSFPNLVNVVGYGNEREQDTSSLTMDDRLRNGEILYNYSGSYGDETFCIGNKKYFYQYVSDASVYSDDVHVDADTLDNTVKNIIRMGCSFLKNNISFYYNDNFFEILSDDDIKVTGGIYQQKEENGKSIFWNLGSFPSGRNYTMTIIFHIKSSNFNDDSLCTSNNKCSINSLGVKSINVGRLDDSIEQYIFYNNSKEGTTSISALSIHDKYYVKYKYDNGACDVATENRVTNQLYRPFESVTFNQDDISCNGYSFLGWMYPTQTYDQAYYTPNDGSKTFRYANYPYFDKTVYFYDIKKVNDETFLMPAHDVYLFPIWESVSVSKEFTSTTNSTTQGDAQSIYNSFQEGRDVLFGGFCWKMINKVNDVGVTLLYNGVPDVSGNCEVNTNTHDGSTLKTSINLDDEYYYSSGYDYDNSLKKYTLRGDLVKSSWNDTTASDLIGKYTCRSNMAIKTCDELYYISGYNSESSAYVIKYDSNIPYNQIGISEFNSSDNSIAYRNYVYGQPYQSQYIDTLTTRDVLLKMDYSDDYYYGNSISFADDKYTISDLNLISSLDNKNELIGKYTYFKDDSSFSDDEVYYIAGVDEDYIYYLQLYDGEEKNDIEKSYYFSKTYTTDNNLYTLDNPIEIKNTEWFNSSLIIDNPYEDKYYVCENSATCSSYLNVAFTNKSQLGYYHNILYSDSVSYDNQTGKYTLENPQTYQFQSMDFQGSDNGIIESNKYSCSDMSNTCEDVYYIENLYADHGEAVVLTDGINYEDASVEMNNPKYDSDIKKVVDAWYKNYLIDYEEFLVDAWPELHNVNNTYNYPISILGFMSNDSLYSGAVTTENQFWVGNETFLLQKSILKAFAVYMNSNGSYVQNNFTDSVTSVKGVRPIIVLSTNASVEKKQVDDTSVPLKVIDGNTY